MYKPFKPQPARINSKINQQITAPELRVIDEQGNNLEVMPFSEALKLAQSKGLDLIEIAPTAKPPVARIMSFDKYRYQKEKELKKQRATQKTGDLKKIQISVREAKNDLDNKVKKIEEFIQEGHKVEITLRMRGREKANKDWARLKLDEFVKMFQFEYKIILEPKYAGKGLIMQIDKK